MSSSTVAYAEASPGRIPTVPPCEVYCHSLTDPSILSDELRSRGVQTLTLFGLHMPARLFTDDGAKRPRCRRHAPLARLGVLAEPLEDCVLRARDGTPCLEALTPPEIEAELGMPRGHIFHRDLAWPFAESDDEVGTWGVETEHAERVAVRRRRAPGRGRQRYPGPQRGPRGARALGIGLETRALRQTSRT